MDLTDWLLFLHVLSAFVAVAALTALWALVLATRPASPVLAGEAAGRLGTLGGMLVGVGMAAALVFGIWLTLDIDGYELWDGWILGAIVLWLIGGGTGDQAGRAFEAGDRGKAIRMHAISSAAMFVILVLMIWKPGA